MTNTDESQSRRIVVRGEAVDKTDAMLDAEKRIGGECARAYIVRRLADGADLKDIAAELGVTTTTLWGWRNRLRITDLEVAEAKVAAAASG